MNCRAPLLALVLAATGCATPGPARLPAAPLVGLVVPAPGCADAVETPAAALLERSAGAAAIGTLAAVSDVLAARYAACGLYVERVLFEGPSARVLVRPAGADGPAAAERWVQDGPVWRLVSGYARARAHVRT